MLWHVRNHLIIIIIGISILNVVLSDILVNIGVKLNIGDILTHWLYFASLTFAFYTNLKQIRLPTRVRMHIF